LIERDGVYLNAVHYTTNNQIGPFPPGPTGFYASGQYGDLEPTGLKGPGNDTLLWPHCSGNSFFNAANPPQYDKIAIVVPKGN